MDIIEKATELGKAINQSEQLQNYILYSDKIYDLELEEKAQMYENAILVLGKYKDENLKIVKDAQKIIQENNEDLIVKYVTAKMQYTTLINEVNSILTHFIGEKNDKCSSGCSKCSGCSK